MTETPDVRNVVAVLLAGSGLHPSDEEFEILAAAYPMHKEGIESLYAVVETRYEAPALVFDPTPVFADWSS
jgi:hypothetical protein